MPVMNICPIFSDGNRKEKRNSTCSSHESNRFYEMSISSGLLSSTNTSCVLYSLLPDEWIECTYAAVAVITRVKSLQELYILLCTLILHNLISIEMLNYMNQMESSHLRGDFITTCLSVIALIICKRHPHNIITYTKSEKNKMQAIHRSTTFTGVL